MKRSWPVIEKVGNASPPTRGRGLKPAPYKRGIAGVSRPPRGGVG